MESQGELPSRTSPFTSQSSPAPGTNSDHPRPSYFVARKDGTLTPLIAVDELPDSLRIVGVPATISPAATVNMMSLGVVDRSQHKYTIEASGISDRSIPGQISTSSLAHESNSSIPEKPLVAPNGELHEGTTGSGAKGVEQWRQDVKSIDETQAAIDAVIEAANENATAGQASVTDAGTPGTFGKKVYCTHWIRWGECDYTQQGCLYKHEMPDEATLISIGIRTTPKWYRDASAPKNGWLGRPAPSDQLWRGKPVRPAQSPQPPKHLSGPAQPNKFVRPVTAPRPATNGPFAGSTPFYQTPVPPGPKLYGKANETPEQRRAALSSYFSTMQVPPISAPPVLNTTQQQVQSCTVPNHSPLTSPPATSRSSVNIPTTVAPSYSPLAPSFNPSPAAPSSVAAPPPKSSSPSYVEPQTPVPMHRRLFVPAGESLFVANPVPANEGKEKAKEGKKVSKGTKKGVNGSANGIANGNGNGIGNGNVKGDFLLDLE